MYKDYSSSSQPLIDLNATTGRPLVSSISNIDRVKPFLESATYYEVYNNLPPDELPDDDKDGEEEGLANETAVANTEEGAEEGEESEEDEDEELDEETDDDDDEEEKEACARTQESANVIVLNDEDGPSSGYTVTKVKTGKGKRPNDADDVSSAKKTRHDPSGSGKANKKSPKGASSSDATTSTAVSSSDTPQEKVVAQLPSGGLVSAIIAPGEGLRFDVNKELAEVLQSVDTFFSTMSNSYEEVIKNSKQSKKEFMDKYFKDHGHRYESIYDCLQVAEEEFNKNHLCIVSNIQNQREQVKNMLRGTTLADGYFYPSSFGGPSS